MLIFLGCMETLNSYSSVSECLHRDYRIKTQKIEKKTNFNLKLEKLNGHLQVPTHCLDPSR